MNQTAHKPPIYYSSIIALLHPLYRQWVMYKKDTLPHYDDEMAQRFGGRYPDVPAGKVIWCHAVSLGELNTAYSLLQILLNHGFSLFVTSTTQTGYNRTSELFCDEITKKTVAHSFVPIDDRVVIKRFLAHVRPVMALFIETELWANTLYALKQQHILSVLVNARLNDRSYRNYAKFAKVTQSMLDNLSLIIAQDTHSAKRFAKLGADDNKIKQAMSLKWATKPINPILPKVQLNRPVWVAASTHEGEEVACLLAHQVILQTYPNAILLLVPRHPKRFDEVWQLCLDSGLNVARRSTTTLDELDEETQVYLADSMGELLIWYAIGDVAFVGGSLVNKGGHNPIEPAYFAKPMIIGQYTKNCDVLVDEFIKMAAMVKIFDGSELAEAVLTWFDDKKANEKGKKAKQLVTYYQHADKMQAQLILDLMFAKKRV